ncbi:MAG: Asp-tRNA(Asn)/Glu-tRNA(Gln) amidotransferase subunit GatA, partial [Acidimicrobiia bacterium]|nr:Asp-tRNA(Asn)/Glu-tRNA(Gln) amidotransferase subunit GatA [Acidimicrobiia bacterium]
MSLADLTIASAADGLRAGDFGAVDLLEAVLERASMTEAQLHAYLTIEADRARTAAAESDRRR